MYYDVMGPIAMLKVDYDFTDKELFFAHAHKGNAHISILPTRNVNFTFLSRPRHAAIQIANKHKVVCAQNLMSDLRLMPKQNRFCDKQKKLIDEFKTKVILYPFQNVSLKSKNV